MEVESEAVDIIGDTFKFLLECKESGEILSKQAPPSIYMVPSRFRDLNPSSFSPKVVAIGPLHRKDEHLQEFEVQKTAYLHNWLRLGMEQEQVMRECVEKVIGSIERIKASYGGLTTYDDFQLAKMMVIDACFILEFAMVLISGLLSEGVSSTMLTISSILPDLVLIENQIPFLVLEIIFECTALRSQRLPEGASLTDLITILASYFNFVEGNVAVPQSSAPDHILGFLHKYYRPAEWMPPVSQSCRKHHTAMELDRAGMKFKPNTENQNWALAINLEFPLPLYPWLHTFMAIPPYSWFQRPTLRMPKVRIGDYSELIFRNLIIYEQASDVDKYVTAYLVAMDFLIDTPQDAAVLVKSKVLEVNLGSNDEAVVIINNLCKNITFIESCYDQQWAEMDAYYNSYWPNTVAEWKTKYFNYPWSFIALIAAFVLFALTVVQTIFTIKGTV